MLRIRTFGGSASAQDGGVSLSQTALEIYYIQGSNSKYYTAANWSSRTVGVNATGFILYRHASIGNRLIWYKNSSNGRWGAYGSVPNITPITTEPDAALDYSGSTNTNYIVSWGSANVEFADSTNGFIPAYGEAKILFANTTDFDNIVAEISGDSFSDIWTSTIYDDYAAWTTTGDADREDNYYFRHIKSI